MTRKSRFIPKKSNLSNSEKQFEKWLIDEGYFLASDFYPAAVSAVALLQDFLGEYPELEDEEEKLRLLADEIGLVSNFDDEIDDEEPYVPLDPDEPQWG